MWKISFHSFDLDLDSMISVFKLDLDIVKMYVYTENAVSNFRSSKVIAWTDR